jgi:hypothetical protein
MDTCSIQSYASVLNGRQYENGKMPFLEINVHVFAKCFLIGFMYVINVIAIAGWLQLYFLLLHFEMSEVTRVEQLKENQR